MTAPLFQSQLDKIRPVYDEIHQLHQRWECLQTVEQASLEYQTLLATEETQLTTLKKQKENLLEEKNRLTRVREDFDDSFFPPENWQWQQRKVVPFQPLIPQTRPNQEAAIAIRSRLKKLVNRWAKNWGLENTVLGQINCIADDTDRPLGEALILLDWSIFADPTLTRANESAHLERLREWQEALVEYRQHLAGEIDTLETRFRSWLGIWELWRSRDLYPENQECWNILMAETKQTKLEEITKLTGEILLLKQEIASLAGMPTGR